MDRDTADAAAQAARRSPRLTYDGRIRLSRLASVRAPVKFIVSGMPEASRSSSTSRPAKQPIQVSETISEKKPLASCLFTFVQFRSSTRRRFLPQFDLIVIDSGTDEIFQGTLVDLVA